MSVTRVISFFSLVFLLGFYFEASAIPGVVAETASVACLAQSGSDSATGNSQNSNDVLRSFGIRVQGNVGQFERDVLASALRTMDTRSRGALKDSLRDPPLQFISTSGAVMRNAPSNALAAASATELTVNKFKLRGVAESKGSARREAYLTHELGHSIGKRNGKKFERMYEEAVGVTCEFTTYCTHTVSQEGGRGNAHGHRREEFAEVFTAFIYDSKRLQSQCPDAFNFMAKEVYKLDPKEAVASCDSNPVRRVYQNQEGEYVDIGDSEAPKGSTAFSTFGFDPSGLLKIIATQNLQNQRERAEQQKMEEMQKQRQLQYNQTMPAGTGGTKVDPEQFF